MRSKKQKWLIGIIIFIICAFLVSPVYSKYTNRYTGTINISIRKPNYTVTFNSNAPSSHTASGTMDDQAFVYGTAQNLRTNNYTVTDYQFYRWQRTVNGSDVYYNNGQSVNNLSSIDNSVVTLNAVWNYIATPTISRSDYNTFTYTASSAAAYYVSTTNSLPAAGNSAASTTFALNTWTTATSTGDLNLASGQTYYVWAKDATTGGRVSANSASIAVRTITRSVGTGSALTTKLESSSGTAFTGTPYYVLNGTVVYVSATANSGYRSPVLTKGGSSATNNTTYTITADTAFASSATPNKVTININKDGSAWSASGMKVTLYNGTTATSYTATVSSGSTATLSAVPNGTYNVYAGKDSSNKTSLIDSGLDITVNNNDPSGTINYYSVTLVIGTNISAVSNGGTSTTSAKQYLYISDGTQQDIAINATLNSGYTWCKWTKTSGTTPATFTAATKSQNIQLAQGAVTLKAWAGYYLVDKVSVGSYVAYPAEYTNVRGDATKYAAASATGWRVLKKSGSGNSGSVILISAGIPLSYNYTAKSNTTTANNELAILKSTTSTGFFSINMNKNTLTDKNFHNCGFSGISSTSALRELFINDYTKFNTYSNTKYPVVRAMSKNDLDTAYKTLSGSKTGTSHGTDLHSYDLLALTTSKENEYAPYVVADINTTAISGKYHLWTVYNQGVVVETSGDKGIRLVIELKTGVMTSGTSGGKWQLIPN